MLIVRLPEYLRALKRLRATEAEVEALERTIAESPFTGDVIPGLSGLRKIRFRMAGRGKRGGGRAIYYVVTRRGVAYMVSAYAKSEREDVSEREKRLVRGLVQELDGGGEDDER